MSKVNSNVKSFKAQRDTLGQAHVALHTVHDTKLESNTLLRNLRGQLKTFEERLEKTRNGHHGWGTVEELTVKVDDLKAQIEDEINACKGRVDIYADAIQKALDSVSKETTKAIRDFMDDRFNSALEIKALTAIVKQYADWGLEVNTDFASEILSGFGLKSASDKVACQKYVQTMSTVGNHKACAKLFILISLDHPSIKPNLPIYKYEHIFEDKARERGKTKEESAN